MDFCGSWKKQKRYLYLEHIFLTFSIKDTFYSHLHMRNLFGVNIYGFLFPTSLFAAILTSDYTSNTVHSSLHFWMFYFPSFYSSTYLKKNHLYVVIYTRMLNLLAFICNGFFSFAEEDTRFQTWRRELFFYKWSQSQFALLLFLAFLNSWRNKSYSVHQSITSKSMFKIPLSWPCGIPAIIGPQGWSCFTGETEGGQTHSIGVSDNSHQCYGPLSNIVIIIFSK